MAFDVTNVNVNVNVNNVGTRTDFSLQNQELGAAIAQGLQGAGGGSPGHIPDGYEELVARYAQWYSDTLNAYAGAVGAYWNFWTGK